MVMSKWLHVNPSQEIVEGMGWLDGLYDRAKKGDLSKNDNTYLEELAQALAEADDEI